MSAKTTTLNIRCTPEEKASWAELAGGERVLSAYVRNLLNDKTAEPVSLGEYAPKKDKKKPTEECARWMHHRKGVYCGTCKKVHE